SGCCWEKGHGKIFYFRPGHETFPIYHDPNVQKVLLNAVRWAAPKFWGKHECPRRDPLETIG
ncbi:MAG: ThuA domain-containing protein, partial [Candidatus Omnitrophica bacterium]|nr:ThuA domain-containing protein [Candidatus Omnitrophota bacterium]